MRLNNKQQARTILALITVTLILVSVSSNAQPGYSPRFRMPPDHSVIVPYPPERNYRQDYGRNMQSGDNMPLISLGIHFDPLISWFSTDSYDTSNDGAIPGYNFGISYNRNYTPNYSFSSGINIINAGGRVINRETTSFNFKNYSGIFIVQPGEPITYRITYISVPLGLKLRTNQIGYGRFFTDLGLDPRIVIGGRADIPSLNIKGGNAYQEVNTFNLSFHIMVGMEYPLAGYSNLIVGIGFDKNLFDITRDNGDQPSNVVLQKMLSFRIGMTF